VTFGASASETALFPCDVDHFVVLLAPSDFRADSLAALSAVELPTSFFHPALESKGASALQRRPSGMNGLGNGHGSSSGRGGGGSPAGDSGASSTVSATDRLRGSVSLQPVSSALLAAKWKWDCMLQFKATVLQALAVADVELDDSQRALLPISVRTSFYLAAFAHLLSSLAQAKVDDFCEELRYASLLCTCPSILTRVFFPCFIAQRRRSDSRAALWHDVALGRLLRAVAAARAPAAPSSGWREHCSHTGRCHARSLQR
jgi:hypothetical protein